MAERHAIPLGAYVDGPTLADPAHRRHGVVVGYGSTPERPTLRISTPHGDVDVAVAGAIVVDETVIVGGMRWHTDRVRYRLAHPEEED